MLAITALTLSIGALPALITPRHDGAAGFLPSFEAVDLEGTFGAPLEMKFTADGDLFIGEKTGRVYVYRDGVLQDEPVLAIPEIVNVPGDRGLLSIAIDPDFQPDGGADSWLYVFYTATPVYDEDLTFDEDDQYSWGVLARYPVVEQLDGTWLADETRDETLLGERQPDGSAPDAFATLHSSHAQCTVMFGADGTLLLSHGDGAHFNFVDYGGQDAPGFDDWVHPVTGLRGPIPRDQDSGAMRSQDLRSLSGKVIRIDPETGHGLPSNPFFDGDPTSNASRVWALGFRNPFRMTLVPGTGALDPTAGDPGTIVVGDVGWYSTEEINWIDAPGLNFGWPCREGNVPMVEYDALVAPDPNPFGFLDCVTATHGVPRDAMVSYHHTDSFLSFPQGIWIDEQDQPLGGLVGECIIAGTVYTGGSYPTEYQGRLFYADFAHDYIKTLEFDAAGNPMAVRDFATNVDRLVDLEVHPITGEVHILTLGQTWGSGHVSRIRYGQNLSPTAIIASNVVAGASPLRVDFDGSGSTDPEAGALTYRWDFDDGSEPVVSTSPLVSHEYTASGIFHPELRVTDPVGLYDTAITTIAVDTLPPLVGIISPPTGSLIDPDATSVTILGTSGDPTGGSVDVDWQLDLHHNVHVHPGTYLASESSVTAPSLTLPLDPHGSGPEVIFYEVLLTATKSDGASETDRAWYYPADQVLDPVGTATLITRLDELDPPVSLGAGNPDIEVVRDGVEPPAGAVTGEYFDTFHSGDQGADDWIGLMLPGRPEPYARFTALTFVEGPHFADGGWFDSLDVEVYTGGVWSPVEDLRSFPEYPGADPGEGFERFEFHFAPRYGEGIRVRGVPGGSAGYVTCSELRARLLTTEALVTDRLDLSFEGSLEAKVNFMTPPGPLGFGNPDPELWRNGTMPAAGSTSEWAQFSTFHTGPKNNEDWIGYRFPEPQTIQSVVFQEGLHFPNGGWFQSLRVEVRLDSDGSWQDVSNAVVDPPFLTGPKGSASYETYTFSFDPVIARDLRIVGVPGGADQFVTVAELRAYGPWYDDDACGTEVYGSLQFSGVHMPVSCSTPPLPGHPFLVEIADVDLPEAAPGAMLIGTAPTFVDFGAGVFLVDPTGAVLSPLVFDAAGEAAWFADLPDVPAFAGLSLFLQAGRFAPTHPGGVRYSQGLELDVCQ